MRLHGVDAELLDREQVRELVPFLDFDDARFPISGGLLQRRGGTVRHDAVAWGYARAADARGVDIIENCEVTGIHDRERRGRRRRDDARVDRAEEGRPRVAGNTRGSPRMAGLRLPIESHVLQAFVSEGLKPFVDTVVTFGAGHFYVSQSDKGGLVFGGDLDGYNSYAQRGNLPVGRARGRRRGCALFPSFSRLRVLRTWGGIMDMCDGRLAHHRPRRVDGLYLNGGWCYGGFKATPASGWCFAHSIATGEPHARRGAPSARSLRARSARSTRRAPAPNPTCTEGRMRIKCPYCGERDADEFGYLGAATSSGRQPAALQTPEGLLRLRLPARQPARGSTRTVVSHAPAAAPGFDVERDTRTHAIKSVPLDETRDGGRRDAMRSPTSEAATASRRGGSSTARARCRFSFDGERYAAIVGDTLASALLANGVRLVGRSFKYHRPRGILSAGLRGAERARGARAAARAASPTRARPSSSCIDGLAAASQNRWPSLRFDLQAVNSLLAPFFGAGFYYKTFMWPSALWEKLYEPAIRRAAGLGRASLEPDPDRYEKAWAHCDVLVDRLGPDGADGGAGCRARGRARHPGGGGFPPRRPPVVGDADDRRQDRGRWAAGACRAVVVPRRAPHAAHDCVRRLRRDHLRSGRAGQRSVARAASVRAAPARWRIVAKRAVLAAGALERP